MSVNIVYKDSRDNIYIASDSRCTHGNYSYQTYGKDISAVKHWKIPGYKHTYIAHVGDVNGKNLIETLKWKKAFPKGEKSINYDTIVNKFVPYLIKIWDNRRLIKYDDDGHIKETPSGLILVSNNNIYKICIDDLAVERIPTLAINGSAETETKIAFKTLLRFSPDMPVEDMLRNAIQLVAENDPTIDGNVVITKVK